MPGFRGELGRVAARRWGGGKWPVPTVGANVPRCRRAAWLLQGRHLASVVLLLPFERPAAPGLVVGPGRGP